MPDWINAIRDQVAASQLEEALLATKKAALSGVTDLDTPVILLQAELEYLKKQVINGLVDRAEEIRHRQQISARLLSMLAELPGRSVQSPDSTPDKTIVLFLGANPLQHLALDLDREVREVSAGLQHFGKRAAFDFRARMHVSPVDLQRMLLESDYSPRFVHFAGNAVVNHPLYGSGLLFENDRGEAQTVDGDLLSEVFCQFPGIECVFLNTCDSGPTALAVGQHIRYAIGMNARIYDECAIAFAVAFYEAVAGGKDIPFAFEYARKRLLLGNYAEQATIPVLIENGACKNPVYVEGASHIEQPAPRLTR